MRRSRRRWRSTAAIGFPASGSFCSGCDNAQWQLLGGMIPQADGPPQPGFFLLRTADIGIDDNWHTMGLAGTGSKTIVADNAFVPTHRALAFAELADATAPGMRAHTNPLYRQSFLAVLPITIVSPVLGMAEGALADFLDMAKVRTTRGAVTGGNRRMAELTTVQLRVAEATACIDAARLMMFRDLAEAFEMAARGDAISIDVRLRNRRDQAFCVRLLIQAIDALFLAAGGQGLFLDHPFSASGATRTRRRRISASTGMRPAACSDNTCLAWSRRGNIDDRSANAERHRHGREQWETFCERLFRKSWWPAQFCLARSPGSHFRSAPPPPIGKATSFRTLRRISFLVMARSSIRRRAIPRSRHRFPPFRCGSFRRSAMSAPGTTVRHSGFTALGLRKLDAGQIGHTINGVLYPVEGPDMSNFDVREKGYVRVEVPLTEIEAVGWQRLPEAAHIWTYVPVLSVDHNGSGVPGQGLPEPDAMFPLLQSYIDVVVEGGLEYGQDFAREILETTDGWSHFWLNDRELARRPWVHDPRSDIVDGLLTASPAAAAEFPSRAFPEIYGERLRAGTAK